MGWTIGVRSLAGAKDFSSSPCVLTGSGAHPASYPMGTETGKARPERDADHSPPSSAEVKYESELYLLSPLVPPWHIASTSLPTLLVLINGKSQWPYGLRAHSFGQHEFCDPGFIPVRDMDVFCYVLDLKINILFLYMD
jgi:hypothetical protein